MKKFVLLCVIFLLLFFESDIFAQRTEKYFSLGVQLNALNYFGDMNPLEQYVSTEISYTRPNFGFEATKKITNRLHIRGSFGYGRLRGDDFVAASPDRAKSLPRYGRNLHFRNDIFELAFIATYDIFPSRGRFYRRRYFTPYVFAGIAGFYHNPKALTPRGANGEEGEWVALKPLKTEGQGLPGYDKEYSLIQPAIPLGVGVRWRLTDRLDLGFEMGFRILFFDHLDDLGGRYPDIRDLESDLARRMYERSTEPLAAVSGNRRELEKVIPVTGDVSVLYGSYYELLQGIPLQTFTGPNGETYTRLLSYGLEGDKRGNSPGDNDLYLITGFHINYIFSTKRFPRFKPY